MAKMKAFKKLKNHAEYTSLLQFLGKKTNFGQKEVKNHLKEFNEYCCIKESQIRQYKNPSVTF